MKEYGGLFFVFVEPEHRDALLRRIQRNTYFTFGVSDKDFLPELAEVCLLSFDGKSISHICLARKSKLSETGRMALKFERFLSLASISPEEFNAPSLTAAVKKLFDRGVTRISADEWQALIAAIKLLRPENGDAVGELDRIRRSIGVKSNDGAFQTVAEEKDATRLALEIFGLEKEEMRHALEVEPLTRPAPFLKGLKRARVLEDSMIFHDASVFPEMKQIANYVNGAVEFMDGKDRITVLNVNRTPIERVTGVDLIYYNHTYHAYIMVQYKRMQKIPSDWEFNLRDKQFLADVSRIEAFEEAHPRAKFTGRMKEYRLNSKTFFFKFCEEITFKPMSTSMIRGMYLPFGYMKCLLKSPTIVGPLGGRVLRYGNCERHLSNSQFITLVRDGWIGSRTDTTDVITRLIRSSVEAGRSVILGIEDKEED